MNFMLPMSRKKYFTERPEQIKLREKNNEIPMIM